MTGTELQPLASALVAAVLGSTPSLDTQDDSPLAGAFEAASSLRYATPAAYCRCLSPCLRASQITIASAFAGWGCLWATATLRSCRPTCAPLRPLATL